MKLVRPSSAAWAALPLLGMLAAAAATRAALHEGSPQGAAAAAPAEEIPSPAYRTFAEAQIAREFRKQVHRPITDVERQDALWLFEDRARGLPSEVARELIAREHRNLEARADLDSRGALGLARNLAGGGAGPLEDLVATREAAEALFRRVHPERRVPVDVPGAIGPRIADGATIELPKGVFELGNVLGATEPFPADVTLAGSGRDATLVVLEQPLDAGGPLERFTLRDATVLAGSGRLFSQARGAAVVRLERVRVVGFDRGADVAGLLRFGEALVLDARECLFEGGFGDVPDSGTLFDVPREALLARLEGCLLSRMSLRLSRHPRGTTIRFERCRLEDVLDDPAADAARRRGIDLVECEIELHAGELEAQERRQVDELFPGWRERLVR